MNWTGVIESIVAAVSGALILTVCYWVFPRVTRRKPIDWFDYEKGSTRLDKDDYQSSVAYCTVVLRNKTRNVIRDIEVLFNGPFEAVEVPQGSKIELSSQGEDHRLRISSIQPKAEVRITANRSGSEYLRASHVFVGDEDMGDCVRHKVVKDDSITLSGWWSVVFFPIAILSVSWAVGYLVFSVLGQTAN